MIKVYNESIYKIELDKDILVCDSCGELFNIPNKYDECPYCGSKDFHTEINKGLEVSMIDDTSRLGFGQMNANQRLNNKFKRDKVVNGYYYVLYSKCYGYYSQCRKENSENPDEATIFTSIKAINNLIKRSSSVRDKEYDVHKVAIINKHVIKDLDK